MQDNMNRGVPITFRVDPSFLGKLIGKNGANIRKAQTMPGVFSVNKRDDGTVIIMAANK